MFNVQDYYKKISKYITPRRALVGAFGFSLLILTINLVYLYLTTPFNSDDVAQLTMLKYFSLHQLPSWMPPDPYFLKVPFNAIALLIFGDHSRRALFASSWFALSAAYALFVYSVYKIIQIEKPKESFVKSFSPAIAITSSTAIASFVFAFSLRSPHIRTIEIGLAAFVFWKFTQRWHSRSYEFSKSTIVISSIFIGLFFYNDPGFIYFVGLPIAVISVYRLLNNVSKKYFSSLLIIGLAFLIQKIIALIISAIGLKSYSTGATFVVVQNFGNSFTTVTQGFLQLFNADIFGRAIEEPYTVVKLIYFASVILGFYSLVSVLKKGNDGERLFAISALVALGALLFSTRATDVYSARYIITVPFCFAALMAISLSKGYSPTWIKRGGMLLLVTVTALNLFISTAKLAKVESTAPNEVNSEIAKSLNANERYQKGYASYWMANINSYFGNLKQPIVPITCAGKDIGIFYWVMYEGYSKEVSNNSFIVVSEDDLTPNITINSPNIRCNRQEALEAFGKPNHEDRINDSTYVMYYDYDISNHFLMRTTTSHP